MKQHILKIRSQLAFVIGLLCAAGFALSVETGVATSIRAAGQQVIPTSDDQTQLASFSRLSLQDQEYARTAWTYFENNTQPETGMVNSANGYPSTTVWDQASYMLGLISAQRIGLIDDAEFYDRAERVLTSLANLPLFDGKLPNKVYDTRSLEMTNYKNEPVPQGIGWSALDVARVTVPLNIMLYDYPRLSSKAGAILTNWDFSAMLKNGSMYGARVHEETGLPELVQEGRLGYEEYGARAVGLLGLDALVAARSDDYLVFERVSGVRVGVDSRSFAEFDAHNYVVSEPYILTAVEFGFDRDSRELAHRIFSAQQSRYEQTGIPTAVSEDNIDQEPYFIYNTVFANGQEWLALAEDGTAHPDKRTVSTKAVFGWDAIYGNDYTKMLMEHIKPTRTVDKGWLSGLYEADNSLNDVATANTNAIILQTLQYKANGPLLAARFQKGTGS